MRLRILSDADAQKRTYAEHPASTVTRNSGSQSARGVDRGEREAKARTAVGGLVVRRDASAMSFDYRATDRQAHADASLLGREEAVEGAVDVLGGDARAAVLDSAAQYGGVRSAGPDGDAALRASRLRHGLRRIDGQVHDHLLELGAVADHPRKRRCQIEENRNALRLQLMAEEYHRLLDDVIERQGRLLRCPPFRQRPDTGD